jgi:uncharacterized protein YjiK
MLKSPHFCSSKDCVQLRINLLVLVFFMVFTSFCDPDKKVGSAGGNDTFAYQINAPDGKYELPSYLEEVSGLSYCDHNKIACVQDEKGKIYVLDLEQRKIGKKYDFGEDGDYEDIAVVDKIAYILENDGNIYRVKDFKKKDREVKKYNTPLREINNTEGLTYDPQTNSLLIACKGSPSIHKENRYEGYKAVYRFDLEKEELEEDPLYLVDLERLDSYIDRNAFIKLSLKVARSLRLIESETSFQPSGISIHPLSGEIFIISSVGKLLIILNREGKVLDVKELDPEIFRQPEGICFSPEGDMYISNEGQGGKGYVLKFKFHESQE